jgi:hypothetical protein
VGLAPPTGSIVSVPSVCVTFGAAAILHPAKHAGTDQGVPEQLLPVDALAHSVSGTAVDGFSENCSSVTSSNRQGQAAR